MNRARPSPLALGGLYVFAVVLMVSPIVDLFSTVWPLRFGELSWRYGFLGLGAGYLHTPLLGLVLAAAVAYWAEHATSLRVIGFLSVALSGALVPVLALWPLDFQQMRALGEEAARRGILIGGVIQELKYLSACVVLALVGLGALSTAREIRRKAAKSAPGIVSRG